jgi:hypothetical protein
MQAYIVESFRFDHPRGALAELPFAANHDQHGRGVLDSPAQAEPGGQRDAPRDRRRDIAQVQRHHAEASGMADQVGGFQGVQGVSPTAHPQQLRQADARFGGRDRVEGVGGVHQGADFALLCGRGQDGVEQAGATGRGFADDLGSRPPGKAPFQTLNLHPQILAYLLGDKATYPLTKSGSDNLNRRRRHKASRGRISLFLRL